MSDDRLFAAKHEPPPAPMTVRELHYLLGHLMVAERLDPDMKVALATDPEGNDVHLLSGYGMANLATVRGAHHLGLRGADGAVRGAPRAVAAVRFAG